MSVTSLQHVGLEVPDIPKGLTFYADAGLETAARDGMGVVRCQGRAQDQIRLVEGSRKKLHHVCFGTDAEGLSRIRAALEKDRVRLLDAPNESPDEGIWVRDPDGIFMNIKIAEAAPSEGGPHALGQPAAWETNTPGHFDRLAKRAAPPRDIEIHPRRLGHILQFTPDVERKIDFYTRLLGMRVADRVGDLIGFMYLEGGSDHHVVALAKSDGPGLHHASFEMANADQISLNAARMVDKGHQSHWGFGRHVIGSNFFHYMRDPWNGLIEFFSDIDYIPADCDWEPQNWPEQDSLYLWGPELPDDFITNYETAS